MVNYECKVCNYITIRKSNYQKHLNTQKHKNNITIKDIKGENNGNISLWIHKDTQKIHKDTQKIHKDTQRYTKDTQMLEKVAKSSKKVAKSSNNLEDENICKFCGKKFNTRKSMLRHIRSYCKSNQDIVESKELKKIIKNQSKQITKFEKLLENTGNQINTNNNTQNNDNSNNKTINHININNYGEENLEMLTDDFKKHCVRHPYYALIKIIEKIHFNDEYPENKNIRLLNKRDNKLQVRDNGKWNYRSKEVTIKEALDDSNERLEQFYEEKSKHFRKIIRLSCKEIIKNVQESDAELLKNLYREMNLMLFNN